MALRLLFLERSGVLNHRARRHKPLWVMSSARIVFGYSHRHGCSILAVNLLNRDAR